MEYIAREERYKLPHVCKKHPKLVLAYQIAYLSGRGDRVSQYLEVWVNVAGRGELVASKRVRIGIEDMVYRDKIIVGRFTFVSPKTFNPDNYDFEDISD